jgi:phosphoglycerate dehydrogenase-like enzyme
VAKIHLYQRLRKWPAPAELFDFFERPELSGQTLVVAGSGAIGGRVAEVGKAFGMRVVGIRRSSPVALQDVVSEADYLVLCLPLTPQTRGLIGRDVLDRMKSSAILINVGRGAVVDETALVESLRGGGIAGAALDVFAQEPLPADHPFYEMENVIVSPHVAGATPRYDSLVVDVFVENLKRYLAGQPLLNTVDWSAGY